MSHMVSSDFYRKYFAVLLSTFTIIALLEFMFSALGMPIGEMYIVGLDLDQNIFWIWLVRALFSGIFTAGFVNFFIIIKVIKLYYCLDRLPTILIVIMTILFPLEILISTALVIPNLVIFGFKSRSFRRQETRGRGC